MGDIKTSYFPFTCLQRELGRDKEMRAAAFLCVFSIAEPPQIFKPMEGLRWFAVLSYFPWPSLALWPLHRWWQGLDRYRADQNTQPRGVFMLLPRDLLLSSAVAPRASQRRQSRLHWRLLYRSEIRLILQSGFGDRKDRP